MTAAGTAIRSIAALWVAALVLIAPPSSAQTAPAPTSTEAASPTDTAPAEGVTGDPAALMVKGPDRGFDYAGWEKTARRAEETIATAGASIEALETLRATLAGFRSAALEEQDRYHARIETLTSQLDALGPAPADGATEAASVAARRGALTSQLAEARAPVVAAEEAFRRADGMIGEIDAIIRARLADRFTAFGPSPLNPANWPEALQALSDYADRVAKETTAVFASDAQRVLVARKLPLSLALAALGLALIIGGRRFLSRLAGFVPSGGGRESDDLRAILLSLTGLAVPLAAIWLIARAVMSLGVTGMAGDALLAALPLAGLFGLGGGWLGGVLFGGSGKTPAALDLDNETCRRARRASLFLGLILAIHAFLEAMASLAHFSEAAHAVVAFPLIVLGGLSLIRMGRVLDPSLHDTIGDSAGNPLQERIYQLLARGLVALGGIAPLGAAVGYGAAAQSLVYPAILTLALLGTLLVAYRFLDSLAERLRAATRGVRREEGDDGLSLVPVLLGFVLICLALPLLALVWGARPSDLGEVWTRINEGFDLGGRHISVGDFVVFAVVFAIGYTATRLIQSGLRNSVLPRTRLDAGGRNAILTGTGYVGIFLSALAAITAAGIDLSGIALVAGALSVGIGFGLQAIVSNFVSGIILLVERPIKEGDWIEVGTYSGTVRKISVRATEIETFDRSTLVIPNADLISGTMINYTHGNLQGRVRVPVGVAYDSDPDEVRRILTEIGEGHEMVDHRSNVSVIFMGFGADSLDFEIRAILKDINNVLSVKSEMNHQILRRFREAGIEIPFAQRDVNLRNADEIGAGIGKAMEKKT